MATMLATPSAEAMAIRLPKHLLEDDPAVLAPLAGLTDMSDDQPGWSRRVRGRGFTYRDADGTTLNGEHRSRLEALVIPPAWQDVWICPDEAGYLQVTGIDDAGRKQYRYHPDFVSLMDRRKFERLAHFPRALPGVRTAIAADLSQPLGSRRLAVATAAALIDRHLLRVGNEDSADDGHYGATTLLVDHLYSDGDDDSADEEADPGGATGFPRLDYCSKSGQRRRIALDDHLAELLGRFAEGSEDDRLLWFVDPDDPVRGDEPRHVSAAEVNEFVRLHTGAGFSTKDFRTWGGSAAALEALAGGADEVEAVDAAAVALGNTRAVARSSYVHPLVLESDAEALSSDWSASRGSAVRSRSEAALARLLRRAGSTAADRTTG